eukprot:1140729-Pelagomonas_calceolata.AAC.5
MCRRLWQSLAWEKAIHAFLKAAGTPLHPVQDPLVAQAVVAEVGVGGSGNKIHVRGCDLRVARAEGCTHSWKMSVVLGVPVGLLG